MNETTPHILTQCNFTEAVWDRVASKFNLPSFSEMANESGTVVWMRRLASNGSKKEKKG
jgi:hypothetical protein